MIGRIFAKVHPPQSSCRLVEGSGKIIVEPILYEPTKLCSRHVTMETTSPCVVLLLLKHLIEMYQKLVTISAPVSEKIRITLTSQLLKKFEVALILNALAHPHRHEQCRLVEWPRAETE